ncbi:hypothetical protein HAP94_18630 [Acidithiobacillus ferrivorans]|uniref:Tetratricopeptide repeat protein n=1 Tax=mine drainage metagenome TaxID=410659 RepID=E6QGH6_9ZZZZ|nr:hypothetical protein [Acidithiobacillus ferrivorans]
MPSHPNIALLHDAHHPFPEPLIPHGTPGEVETSELQAAITAWERSGWPESFGVLESYLEQHPQSAWNLALQANLGILFAAHARFDKALELLERTFASGKSVEELRLRNLMDRVLGELLHLHAKLGNIEALEQWLRAADKRHLRGAATERRTEARMALWSLCNQTGVAHRCGAAAVKGVLLAKDAMPAIPTLKLLESARSGPDGLSLADLENLADEAGLSLHAMRREDTVLIRLSQTTTICSSVRFAEIRWTFAGVMTWPEMRIREMKALKWESGVETERGLEINLRSSCIPGAGQRHNM